MLILKLLILFIAILIASLWLSGFFELYSFRELRRDKDNAKSLISFISQLICHQNNIALDFDNGLNSIPKYKFHTDLFKSIVTFSYLKGAPLKEPLTELRGILIEDQRFEARLKSHLEGSFIQMISMMLITWAFILFTYMITNIETSLNIKSLILFLQIIGISIFTFYYFKKKASEFKAYEVFFHGIISLKALGKIGVSIQEQISLIPLNQIKDAEHTRLKFIKSEFINSLKLMSTQGQKIDDILDILLQETEFEQKQSFERFEKDILKLKFFVSAAFLLTGYLIFVLSLFSQLMT